MQENKEMIVRIIASVTIATGLFLVVPEWRYFVFFPRYSYMEMSSSIDSLLTVLGFIVMIIPIMKIIAGVGLFMGKRWAWLLAIAVLTFDFLIGLQAEVRMCIFGFNHHNLVIPESDTNVVVEVISMWPTYIISIIAIASVLILIQKPIRKQFDKQTKLS